MLYEVITIIITGFFIEASRMAVTEIGVNDGLTLWSPVGLLLAKAILPLGSTSLMAMHKVLWWFHLILAIV